MTKNIYKKLLILGFSIYFLFSISVIRGAVITYQSIAYSLQFGGFLELVIFNYIRILYYIFFIIGCIIPITLSIFLYKKYKETSNLGKDDEVKILVRPENHSKSIIKDIFFVYGVSRPRT